MRTAQNYHNFNKIFIIKKAVKLALTDRKNGQSEGMMKFNQVYRKYSKNLEKHT